MHDRGPIETVADIILRHDGQTFDQIQRQTAGTWNPGTSPGPLPAAQVRDALYVLYELNVIRITHTPVYDPGHSSTFEAAAAGTRATFHHREHVRDDEQVSP